MNHGFVDGDIGLKIEEKAYITFGSQMGDQKAAEAVQQHLIELRKLLKKYCIGPYASDITEFAPIARIDGDIWYWNFEGCQKLRVYKKEKYVTIDIGMPKSRWVNATPLKIRQYLIVNLKQALIYIVDKLKKEKYIVREEDLFRDYKNVETKFIGIGI